MSQRAFLRSIDDQIMGAMLGAGMADSAVYEGGAGAVSCSAYVDRAAQVFGDDEAEVAGVQTLVTFCLAEVGTLEVGARVTVDGEAFELVKMIREDESLSTWVVVRE
jgi:hypothetical protein